MYTKKNKFNVLRMIVFILVGMLIFIYLNKVLIPSHNYPLSIENMGMNISELESKKHNLDVLFLGSSHMEFGISPMRLYEKYNMVTYCGATSGQPIEMSYYLLKKYYEEGNAVDLVILDAISLFTDNYAEYRYRNIMDNRRFNINEIEVIESFSKNIAEDNNEVDKLEVIASFVFPIIKYHDRWQNITSESFNKKNNLYFMQGFVGASEMNPAWASVESANFITRQICEENGIVFHNIISKSSNYTASVSDEEYYLIKPSEEKIKYLIMISDLCQKHGGKFLLTKIPVMTNPTDYKEAWSYYRYENVKKIAEQQSINYFDLMYDGKIDIDWNHGTCDCGAHLNMLGAEQTTDFIGEYLKNNYTFEKKDSNEYDSKIVLYRKYTDMAHIKMSYKFERYLELLNNSNHDFIVIISAKDDMCTALSEKDITALELLGLQTDFKKLKASNSFIAIIDDGVVEYEGVSNRQQDYTTKISYEKLFVSSAGYLSGNTSSIKINDKEYSMNHRGINIVVFDKESGIVIDSAYCDTWEPEHEVYHDSNKYLFDYLEYLLERR